MPAPISVIVPVLNAEAALPGLALALMEGLEAGLIRELVVSDGGSCDRSVAIAEEAGARVMAGVPGRGGQIARAVAAANADWLLILHADSWPDPGWAAAVADHLTRGSDSAGYFRLRFRNTSWPAAWVAGWANIRSRLAGLPYGDQGLLVHRSLLDACGGVPEIPLMEDVALSRALRGQLRAMPATISTSAERYETEGWLRRGCGNLWCLARYLAGADPARLADAYRRRD